MIWVGKAWDRKLGGIRLQQVVYRERYIEEGERRRESIERQDLMEEKAQGKEKRQKKIYMIM